MDRIGFLGLGAMGAPMARNLQKAGFPLSVYNRSPARAEPFRAAGVPVAASPRELAAGCDVVVIMVTGPADLMALFEGEQGLAAGLGPGQVVVNMSTVSPEATAEAAERTRAAGAAFVDAPVSGSVKPAEDAALVVLAGGETAVLDRVEPVLGAMGKAVVRCGGVGQGSRMKLVLNLMLGNMMQSLAEGLVLAERFGLGNGEVLEALAGGAMAAPMYQVKGRAIAQGDFSSQFPVHLMFKDLNLVLEAAGRERVPLPQTAATRECFNAAMARGLGEADMAAVVRVVQALAARD